MPVCDVSCNVSLPSYVILGLRKYFFVSLLHVFVYETKTRHCDPNLSTCSFGMGRVLRYRSGDARIVMHRWRRGDGVDVSPSVKIVSIFFVSKWHASTQSGIALNTVYMTAVCMQQKSLKPFCICEDNLLEFSENCVVGSTLCLAHLGLQFKVQSVY